MMNRLKVIVLQNRYGFKKYITGRHFSVFPLKFLIPKIEPTLHKFEHDGKEFTRMEQTGKIEFWFTGVTEDIGSAIQGFYKERC